MQGYRIQNVAGHVEVFDADGVFCFSADNTQEAMDELREMAA